ncbi:MAG: hypothetical protein HC934_03100 [Acaryochloridaceae cyanobacterium SU_2_1]|nr:hypothetical protein [Acaryochloridaceae cyanobacterium SU_2_1]
MTGAVSYRLGSRLLLWGNAFVPFTGNNSVNRSTGLPAKTVAFNSGIRYLVNPRLGLDVFATNTFGTLGPLALTADREELGLGVGLVAMPDFAPGNRNYPNNFREQSNQPDTQFTTDGLGFFDGGTVPDGKVLIHFQGGSQGVLTALRFGLIKDLEILAYLDYISGTVDESEQGFGVKLRLLNQAEGLPFTASAAVTFGLTNQTFVNFFNNNRDEFSNQGLNKGVPFLLAGEEGEVGKLFVATLSFPVQYQLNDQIAFWFTPIAGFAQRKGLEIGGFSLGGSVEVIQDVSVLAEIGANFLGEGNAFIGNRLADRIPWAFAVRWDASRLFGVNPDSVSGFHPNLELFITNRVGSSPWHQLRVRDQDDIAVGAGLSLSF